MKTGQIIRDLRTNADMSQEQLADELFVSRELVSKWERNLRRPDYPTICKIADLFSVDADKIAAPDKLILKELSKCIPSSPEITSRQLTAYLNEFLRTLPQRDCKIFIRRIYYFETIDEIAQGYGMNPATVRSILFRTRNKLKTYLKEVLK